MKKRRSNPAGQARNKGDNILSPKWFFTVDAGNAKFVPLVIRAGGSQEAIDCFMYYYGIRAYSENIGVSEVAWFAPKVFFEMLRTRSGIKIRRSITTGEFATV